MGQRLYEGMSLREVTDLLFVHDDPERADLILVFGGKSLVRADRAAELYHAGYSPRIYVTGGNPDSVGATIAERLTQQLLVLGVPASAIFSETRSVNTLENVLMSVPQVAATIGWEKIQTVMIVSAPFHMHRAKQVLARHVPRGTRILCCPDRRTDVDRDNWWTTEEGRHLVFRELEKVRRYAMQGEM